MPAIWIRPVLRHAARVTCGDCMLISLDA